MKEMNKFRDLFHRRSDDASTETGHENKASGNVFPKNASPDDVSQVGGSPDMHFHLPDEKEKRFIIPQGLPEVMVGSSSADIRLKQ